MYGGLDTCIYDVMDASYDNDFDVLLMMTLYKYIVDFDS